MMQFLKIRVAQDQAIIGVPQHEGFGNGLDGIAQPQIGLHRALDQRFLFGGVDGDADEMRAGFAVLTRRSQRTLSHSHLPSAWRMRKAWSIDCTLASASWRRQFVKIDVVRMDECADFAEGQEIVLLRQAENVVHRMRPEYAAARQVPIPSPQRPRLSAVSTRLRTVSWMMSASRARVACQWKAKPRISTTKPVVADSVAVNAVVERQSASASLRGLDHGEETYRIFHARTVAKADSPSGSAISMVPAAAPNVVSGCDGPSTSRI